MLEPASPLKIALIKGVKWTHCKEFSQYNIVQVLSNCQSPVDINKNTDKSSEEY